MALNKHTDERRFHVSESSLPINWVKKLISTIVILFSTIGGLEMLNNTIRIHEDGWTQQYMQVCEKQLELQA